MDDNKAAEIIARLKAFKAAQAAKPKESKCPGPREGVVEAFIDQDAKLVLYCRRPDSGCSCIGEEVQIIAGKKLRYQKYLCSLNQNEAAE